MYVHDICTSQKIYINFCLLYIQFLKTYQNLSHHFASSDRHQTGELLIQYVTGSWKTYLLGTPVSLM